MSYILESNGEAIVIDPVFPVEDYIKTANEDLNSKITKIFYTQDTMMIERDRKEVTRQSIRFK